MVANVSVTIEGRLGCKEMGWFLGRVDHRSVVHVHWQLRRHFQDVLISNKHIFKF